MNMLEIIQKHRGFKTPNNINGRRSAVAERLHAKKLITSLIFWGNGEISYIWKHNKREVLYINNINVLKK